MLDTYIFKRSKDLDVTPLPMKGKRHPNGYLERRSAGWLGRAITERYSDYPNYHDEFGHLVILKLIRSKERNTKVL